MKSNIVIRMGASRFTADVRGADGNMVTFDLRNMEKREQHQFRRELVKACKSAGVTK